LQLLINLINLPPTTIPPGLETGDGLYFLGVGGLAAVGPLIIRLPPVYGL
jgi:hypothetical protein